MEKDIIAAIINTVRLLIFVLLSVAFNKWWIILFAPLFMIGKTKED